MEQEYRTLYECIGDRFHVEVKIYGNMRMDEFLLEQIERGIKHGKTEGEINLSDKVEWAIRFKTEEIIPGVNVQFHTSGKYNPEMRSTFTYTGEVLGIRGSNIRVQTSSGIASIKMHHIDKII